MSLINDVLKDLEQRRGQPPETAQRPAAPHRAASRRRHWQWPLWLLAAAGVGVILHLSLDGRNSSPRSPESAPLTAQADSPPTPLTPPEVARPDPKPVQPSPASAEPAAAPTQSAATLQAEVPEATLAQNEPRETPEGQGSPVRSSRARDADQADSQQKQSPVEPDNEPRSTTSPETTDSTSARTQENEATISIRRSGTSTEQPDALAAAKRMLARGQLQRAESRLRQLVDDQPALTEAHQLLARTLIQRRQPGAAIRVLETGLSRAQDPVPLAALLGRLLIERGEVANARSVLVEYAPALSDAPDYHLLLAAAHRQAGDHEQAAEHYRRLSRELPHHGAVWVGLGASLESLEQPAQAVDAYNRALECDDARAARFARQRLAALEPITGEQQ